jgi:hypothetical protein
MTIHKGHKSSVMPRGTPNGNCRECCTMFHELLDMFDKDGHPPSSNPYYPEI